MMQAALDSFNNAKNLPKVALYKGPVTEEMKRREAEETEVRVAKEKAEHEARYAEAKAVWEAQLVEEARLKEARAAEEKRIYDADVAACRTLSGQERCTLAATFAVAAASAYARANAVAIRSVECKASAKASVDSIYELLPDDAKGRAQSRQILYATAQKEKERQVRVAQKKRLLKEQKGAARRAATAARNAAAKVIRTEQKRLSAIERSDALRRLQDHEMGIPDLPLALTVESDEAGLSQTVRATQKRGDRKRFTAQRTVYKMLVPFILALSEEAGLQAGVYPAHVPKSPDQKKTDAQNTKSASSQRQLWRDKRDAHICVTAPPAIFRAAFDSLPKDERVKYALWKIQTTGLPRRGPNVSKKS